MSDSRLGQDGSLGLWAAVARVICMHLCCISPCWHSAGASIDSGVKERHIQISIVRSLGLLRAGDNVRSEGDTSTYLEPAGPRLDSTWLRIAGHTLVLTYPSLLVHRMSLPASRIPCGGGICEGVTLGALGRFEEQSVIAVPSPGSGALWSLAILCETCMPDLGFRCSGAE